MFRSFPKSKSKSKSKLCYDRQSAGQSVLEQSTRLGLTTRYLLIVSQLRSCSCGAPSLTRGQVCFCMCYWPCQRSLSWVRVPWDLRPYFSDSDLRIPFSSPPTTRRVTVEVFDPASTRVTLPLGPFRPSSGVYKQQIISTFITNLRDAMDPLLIFLSYKKFYIRLRCLNIVTRLGRHRGVFDVRRLF
jgi:hypothetical protein